MTTVNVELARKLEPRAPRPDLRLEAVRQLNLAGVNAGVICAPVFPTYLFVRMTVGPETGWTRVFSTRGVRQVITAGDGPPLAVPDRAPLVFLDLLLEALGERRVADVGVQRDDALVGGAEDVGYRAAMTSLAREMLNIAKNNFGATADMTMIAKLYENWAAVSLQSPNAPKRVDYAREYAHKGFATHDYAQATVYMRTLCASNPFGAETWRIFSASVCA